MFKEASPIRALEHVMYNGILVFFTRTLGSRALCRDEEHEHHVCGTIACPLTCQLCKRLCATADHFHALHANAVHLCE
jgi:hypothetical protein